MESLPVRMFSWASAVACLTWLASPAHAQSLPPDEAWNYSDVRLGVLVHDIQFTAGREQSVDLNIEVTSPSPVNSDWTGGAPAWLQFLLHPRLHLGVEPNLSGKTSQLYAGITWSALLGRNLLQANDGLELNALFGPSLNNGKHYSPSLDRESLGSNILFHLGAELTYRITPHILAGLYYDHSSNGGFARHNAGLNDIGLRVGYRF